MKRKILGFCILAILAISCIFASAISSNAETGNDSSLKPYVISKNIEYDSVIYCYYAVPKSSVPTGATPVLDVYKSNGTTYSYTVTEYTEQTVHGIPCYVFSTYGVAPKNINTLEYIVPAYITESGKTEGYGVEYSVLHYLYERLYRNGIILKTEADGDDYIRRKLYFSIMDYAASAQKLFYGNQLASGKVKYIYGDYSYLTVVKGVNYSFVDDGYEIDLTPTTVPIPDGRKLAGWRIYNYDVHGELLSSETVTTSYELSASGITVASPIYAYEDDIDDGKTTRFDTLNESDIILSTSGDAKHQIVDGASVGRPGDNLLMVTKSTGSAHTKKKISTSTINQNADKVVFSIDMLYTGLAGTNGVEIYLRHAGYDTQSYSPVLVLLTFSGTAEGSEVRYSDYTNADNNNQRINLGVEVGEWFNLKIEYYEGDMDTFRYVTNYALLSK